MGDGCCCHECGKYTCECFSSREIRLLACIMELCQEIHEENEWRGFDSDWNTIIYDTLDGFHVELTNHDFKCAKQYLRKQYDS